MLGDTAYDSDRFIASVRAHGMKPVICNNPTRKYNRRRLRRSIYGQRYLVEVFFHNLKRFRAIGTRYDKTATCFLALVHLACAWIWLSSWAGAAEPLSR